MVSRRKLLKISALGTVTLAAPLAYSEQKAVTPSATGTYDKNTQEPNDGDTIRQEMASPSGGNLVQVKQGDPSSRVRSLLDVYKDFVRVEDFVEFGDGRDQGAELQRAFDFACAQGKTLVGRAGWTVGSSRQLCIDCKSSYNGNGMNIIPLGVKSGVFIKISGSTVGVGDINGLRSKVEPGSVGELTGVQIGDSIGQTSGLDFIKWDIYGYDVNLKFYGVNVFILNFIGCNIGGGTSCNISYECTSNAGENIRFSGGTISDAHNVDNTAVALYVPRGVSAPDIRLDKLSMSYNDCNGDIATGIVEVSGVHEENKNTREFWRIRNTVGFEKTIFTKIAGTMASGPLSSGKEPAEGRDAYIVYDGSTSVVVRDVKLGSYRASAGINEVEDYITNVVKHSGIGGAAYRLQVTGCIDSNRSTGIPLDIGAELNQVFISGANAFDGFVKNSSSEISFKTGMEGHGADTRYRALVSSSGGSGSYSSKFFVKPGQTIIAKVSCKTINSYMCTHAGARILYFTSADIEIGRFDLARFIHAPTNAPYIVQFARDKVPSGAVYALLEMCASGLVGEVRFSNERLWVFD